MSARRLYVDGSDGLPARASGEWGRTKLDFLTQFGPIALEATVAKRSRWYVDLYAGPGLNVGRSSGEEFLGSPIRALELVAPRSGAAFTDAFLVNQSMTAHRALEQRIDARYAASPMAVPRDKVRTVCGDANRELTGILDQIHPLDYVFVFADPDAPSQLPWRSIESLRSHRGHRSVDLYVLFPLDMALKRMIGYEDSAIEMNAAAMTEFFGTEDWRECERFRQSGALRHDFGRCLERVYLDRLRTMWRHADKICDVKRESGQRLYTMLFASNHDAGKKIASWAKKRALSDAQARSDQGALDLGSS